MSGDISDYADVSDLVAFFVFSPGKLDINSFAGSLYENSSDYFKYSFHCINVFQSGYAESQQDVANLMEYRPSRDLIIKYDYHSPQYNERDNLQ